MTKYFCDNCGREMPPKDYDRLIGKQGRMMFEIMTGLDTTWNTGCFCHDCIRAAVATTAPGEHLSETVRWFAGEIDREWRERTTWRSTPDVLCALDKALANLKDKDSGAARRIAVYAMRIADNYRTGNHGTATEPPKPEPSLPHEWNYITGRCLYCGKHGRLSGGNADDPCPARKV